MKQQSSPLVPNANKDAEIDRIISRLARVVKTLPLETMISSVRFPGESRSVDIQEIEFEASRQIRTLGVLAGLGREDAVIALRNIGNLAAKELDDLMPSRRVAARTKAVGATSAGSPGSSISFLRPVVELQGDLSPITQILEEEGKAIGKLSAEEIQSLVVKKRIAGRGNVTVNALVALGFSPEILADHLSRTSEASAHYNHPVHILEERLGKIERTESKPASKRRQERASVAMFQVIGYLIEAEITDQPSNIAGCMPSKSLDWPLCVSAFRNDWPEKIESLELGKCLGFRPRSSNARGADNSKQVSTKKPGKPRLIEPGTPAAFALEYCTELDRVRRKYIHASIPEKDDWKKTVIRIEKTLKKGALADEIKRSKAPYNGHPLSMLWTYKSALLPKFPSADPATDPTAATDLGLWIDAAVARARMICHNDWEHYLDWPTCVDDRRKQGKLRKRTAESAVREKLKEGMERLEPDISSAI